MTALPEPAAALVEQSAADATARIARTSKQTMDFVFGAQGILFEEIVFAANEMLDRTRTETHLWVRIPIENGRIALRQRPQDDVAGMRPAPDRLYPSRL
jgi:hypothetical protein